MFETIQIDNVEELKQENAKLKEEVEMYKASASIRKDNLETLKQNIEQLQARIDELMMEYCPEDMTEDQISNYEKFVAVV